MDTKRLIGEVAKRHGLILDEDDPVLLTVTLCEFILDEYVKKLNVNLERAFAREIDRAREEAQTVVARAGAQVAEQVRLAGAAVAADVKRTLGAREVGRAEAATVRLRRWASYCIAAGVGAIALALALTLSRLLGH